jgi:L-iditol 2-dehydrogenase
MRVAVLVPPGRIEMEERPIPSPAPGDVLVRVSAVGVCGSDTHYYRHGRVGGFVVDGPLVLGHEAAGTIVAAGDGVDPARIGQRVSIEPQRPDPDSEETRRGDYNLCPHMQFFGTPPVDGAFCDYVTIGALFAHRVPGTVTDEAAALCEPLSVGIVLTQLARAFGATEIVASDPDEERRRRAIDFGATAVIDPAAEEVGELGGVGFDAFIDASGAPRVTARFPLERAADALDSDRVPGTVKSVVTVS